MAGKAGADPERDRQVRLAGPRRAEQHHVFFAGQEVQLAKVQDGVFVDRVLEREVKLLEGFAGREPCGLDAGLAAVTVTRVGLGFQQRGSELLKGPFLAAGAVSELWQRVCGGGRFELAKQVRKLAARVRSCDQLIA